MQRSINLLIIILFLQYKIKSTLIPGMSDNCGIEIAEILKLK